MCVSTRYLYHEWNLVINKVFHATLNGNVLPNCTILLCICFLYRECKDVWGGGIGSKEVMTFKIRGVGTGGEERYVL